MDFLFFKTPAADSTDLWVTLPVTVSGGVCDVDGQVAGESGQEFCDVDLRDQKTTFLLKS